MQTSMRTLRRRLSTCQVPETKSRSQASSMPKPCPSMRLPTASTRGRPFVSPSKKVKKGDPHRSWNGSRQVLKTLLRWHSPRNLLGCAGIVACWWQRGLCIAKWDTSSIEGNSPALHRFKRMPCLQCLPRACHLRIAWLGRKQISWCPRVLRC